MQDLSRREKLLLSKTNRELISPRHRPRSLSSGRAPIQTSDFRGAFRFECVTKPSGLRRRGRTRRAAATQEPGSARRGGLKEALPSNSVPLLLGPRLAAASWRPSRSRFSACARMWRPLGRLSVVRYSVTSGQRRRRPFASWCVSARLFDAPSPSIRFTASAE